MMAKLLSNVNSQPYFDGNQMMSNAMPAPPAFYQNNNYLPPAQLEGQPFQNGFENNRYAYQPQLPAKHRRRHFNREYANKLISLEIAREIRSEKVRTLIMITFGLLAQCQQVYLLPYISFHINKVYHQLWKFKRNIFPIHFNNYLLLISLGLLFAGILIYHGFALKQTIISRI